MSCQSSLRRAALALELVQRQRIPVSAVRDSGPSVGSGSHAFWHCSPRCLISRSLYLGPLAEIIFSASNKASLWGKEGKPLKTLALFPTLMRSQHISAPSPFALVLHPHPPTTTRIQKTNRASCLELLQQNSTHMRWPHTCADPSAPCPVCPSTEEVDREESVLLLIVTPR